MLKNIFLFLFLSIPFLLEAQEFVCGFKEECRCTKTSIESSFETGNIIFEGKVLFIDTVSIGAIITAEAKLNIEQYTDTIASCAKRVLEKEKIVIAVLEINEMIKGDYQNRTINICTPLSNKSCGYVDFQKGEHFLVYGTIDEIADVFFTYTLDDDFFILKKEFRHFTNFCQRTAKTNKPELIILRKLKYQ